MRLAVGRVVTVGAVAALVALAMGGCSPADVKNTEVTPGSDAGAADGGLSDASFDAGTSADAVCKADAYARCSKLAGCSQAYLETRYGSVAVCETVNGEQCMASVNAPGSGQTVAQVEQCTAAVADPDGWDCDDYVLGQYAPPACATPAGALANGAACLISAQCQSTFCSLPSGSACGVCAPPLLLHASCATNNCPATLVCESTTKTCEMYSQLGATCGAGAPCAVGLTCTAGVNGPTCQSSTQTLNQPCVFSGPGCSFLDGFVCNIQLATCQQVQLVAPGGACGQVSGQQAYCSGGACIFGNCVPYGMPGQPCSMTANGATCISGTRCIIAADGGTSGTCQTIGEGSCP